MSQRKASERRESKELTLFKGRVPVKPCARCGREFLPEGERQVLCDLCRPERRNCRVNGWSRKTGYKRRYRRG